MTETLADSPETRFIGLMSELFQLREVEELDFGIYRVIRRHNQQVRAFLGEIVEESGQPVLRGGELAGIFPKITITCWFMPKMRNAGSRNCCLAPPKWKRDIAIPIMTRVVPGNREIFPLVIPTVKAVIPLPALPGESFLARRRVLIGVYRKPNLASLTVIAASGGAKMAATFPQSSDSKPRSSKVEYR